MVQVVLVEDDLELAEAMVAYLGKEGFQVTHLADGSGAVTHILNARPDIVLLDVELPGESGLSICVRLRAQFGGPIVLLTGRGGEVEEIIGLELGADDYLIKPVQPRKLALKLKSFARSRRSTGIPSSYVDADLHIDKSKRTVSVHGSAVAFTTGEFDLLWFLAQHLGRPVTRDLFYERVRGIDYDGLDRTMDTQMSAVRRKLTSHGFPETRLKTVRGVGYQLAPSIRD